MPASWSAKRKARMENQPHESKPDIIDLLKALEDAVILIPMSRFGAMVKWKKCGALRGPLLSRPHSSHVITKIHHEG
jgi:hypothetical protein